ELESYTLSNIKVEHTIQHTTDLLPKNYRQARKLYNFEAYWLPAMKQQDQSL
ncbi:hypothetical protein QBC35DRAFT_352823, partial [Podospora australis]